MARRKILVINRTYAVYRAWLKLLDDIDREWKKLLAEHDSNGKSNPMRLGLFPRAGDAWRLAQKGIIDVSFADSLIQAERSIECESLGTSPLYEEGTPRQIERDRRRRKCMKPLLAKLVTQEIPRQGGKGTVKVSYALGLGPFPVPTEESSLALCSEFESSNFKRGMFRVCDPFPADTDASGCRVPAFCFDDRRRTRSNMYGCRVMSFYDWSGTLDLRPMYLADAGEGEEDGTVEIAGAVQVVGRTWEPDEGSGEPGVDDRIYAFTRFGPLPPLEDGMFKISGCGKLSTPSQIWDKEMQMLQEMISEAADGAWNEAEEGLMEDQREVEREYEAAHPEDRPDPPCYDFL